MIAICLRCGNTSDNLDTHDEHQLAAGHTEWPETSKLRLPRPLRVECPTCGAQIGSPCLTWEGREVRHHNYSHDKRLRSSRVA